MDFADFARCHGLVIDQLYPADKIKRCPTVDNPRKRNGAYLYLGDRGWVQRWDEGGDVIWWRDPNAKERTQEDIDKWREQRRASEAAAIKRRSDAVKLAESMLDDAKADTHPYLGIKGFHDAKGFVLGEQLLIPMRHWKTNQLQGLQTIWWDEPERKYTKKMLYGTQAKDAAMVMGVRDAPDLCLCEGFVTGLSIHAACRAAGMQTAVMVTFSANNLAAIAAQLDRKAWVFADNDVSGVGQKTAYDTGLPWVMSPHEGMDANDHHQKHGIMSLVGLIMKVKRK